MRSASIQTAFAIVALTFSGMTGVARAAEITVTDVSQWPRERFGTQGDVILG
jgi:hypothetical protein